MAEAWGSKNPHPLSRMKTELVWEGKYDEYGNRREVEVAGLDMPLQKVEAIDEPRQAAVKVIDDRGNELLVVKNLKEAQG